MNESTTLAAPENYTDRMVDNMSGYVDSLQNIRQRLADRNIKLMGHAPEPLNKVSENDLKDAMPGSFVDLMRHNHSKVVELISEIEEELRRYEEL